MIEDARFQVWLTASQPPEPEALIAIAKMSGRNALQVRQAILDGPFIIATGYYDEVEPVRSQLEALGVPFAWNRVDDK